MSKHSKRDEFESKSGDLMDGRGPFEPFTPAQPKPNPKAPTKEKKKK